MKTHLGICSLVVILWLSFNVSSQSVESLAAPDKIAAARNGVEKLRELYQNRDYEAGYELGRNLTEKFPDNIELRAWFIVNMARNEMSAEAVEAARRMVEKNRENSWAWFALANAYIRNLQKPEAAEAAENALKLNPDDEDFIMLYASALLMQRKYDEIYAFLDRNSSKIKDRSRLLVMKAEAQCRQAVDEKKDQEKKKIAFKNFTEAREISPDSVNTNYVDGVYLIYDNRYADAYLPLKNAAALSPAVASVRQDFWKTILQGQPAKTETQKKNEVLANIDDLIKRRPDSVKNLETISAFCGAFALPEKRQEIDAQILKKFPQSVQAENVLIRQIKKFSYFGDDKKSDEKKRSQLIEMLRDFISRPQHFNTDFLGESYTNLFFHIKNNKNISDAELLKIAEDIDRSQRIQTDKVYSIIVEAFADRKMFREGEKFVGLGFEKVKKESAAQRDFIKDEQEIKKNADEMNASLHSANGWLLFKENRLDEAAEELKTAAALDNGNFVIFNRLGQIDEAENKLDEAENAYIKGFASYPSANQLNRASIEKLYEKRNGGKTGIEKYFEKINNIERETRKNRLLAAKIKDAKTVAPFVLKDLNAKTISSNDLSGKIIVVNIWALWCSPCVREMPELQELYKKYQNDKDVVILTIDDNNDEPAKLKQFTASKKLEFPVLRGENYLEANNINAFPTTWFIDRQGKIIYTQIGGSDKLLEEFGWRIEELKK